MIDILHALEEAALFYERALYDTRTALQKLVVTNGGLNEADVYQAQSRGYQAIGQLELALLGNKKSTYPFVKDSSSASG